MENYFFTLYQLRDDVPVKNLFVGLDKITKNRGGVMYADYDRVYVGYTGAKDPEHALEQLYMIFNGDDRPTDFQGRSMSVSDVVKLHDENGNETLWYCDNIGFRQTEFKFKSLN